LARKPFLIGSATGLSCLPFSIFFLVKFLWVILVSNTIKAKQLSRLKSLSFVNVYDWRLTFWCEVFYWVLLSFSPQFSDLCTPIYYLARQVFHGLLFQFQVPFFMMRTIKAGVKTPKLILRLKSYLKLKQLKQVKKKLSAKKESSWWITWRKNDIEIFFASSEEILHKRGECAETKFVLKTKKSDKICLFITGRWVIRKKSSHFRIYGTYKIKRVSNIRFWRKCFRENFAFFLAFGNAKKAWNVHFEAKKTILAFFLLTVMAIIIRYFRKYSKYSIIFVF